MTASQHGLDHHGLQPSGRVHWNEDGPTLLEHAIRRSEGRLTAHGAFVALTAPRTGRSPNDKFVVQEPGSQDRIWWGKFNRPTTPAVFAAMLGKVQAYLSERPELFVQDLHVGADPAAQMPLRVVTENAWHAAFARNMFIRPAADRLAGHVPEFTVLHTPHLQAAGKADGVNSEAFALLDFDRKLILIGGTKYAGEVKKSIFTVMNYLCPLQGILPMHCSSNVKGDNTAIFFGLSGTGKTTLSADPSRGLIGDDEHGWGDSGVFNFEGGCYAKMINLSPEAEPDIFATSRRFGTILENVKLDDQRVPDFYDSSIAENSRGSYPVDFIANNVPSGRGGHPQNVIFLTADAFGVLPPVARLTPDQAAYHFISGYTAKVAGTEVGVTEPQPNFSACFGGPFMPMHPSVYAELLMKKMTQHGSQAWLISTGWTGGPYGVGKRMSIQHTRTLLNAVLDGSLANVVFRKDPRFGFEVPTACPGVPAEVLDARATWTDKDAYDRCADKLARMFGENFQQFAGGCSDAVNSAAPQAVG
ncbi:MAG: phosphoenolpyruvate carboxykinase (ATP) [Myxococcales bacterium]|nr:phosphoenolpyruvate carboxykinase (ATP) [Myxococcales bacterium]